MDVNPHRRAAANDDGRLGDGVKPGPQRLYRQTIALTVVVNDELGAIAELHIIVGLQKVVGNGHRRRLRGVDHRSVGVAQPQVGRRAGIAPEVTQGAANDGDQAQAAGVHHAGLLEDGQLFRRAGQGGHGAVVGRLPDGDGIPCPGVAGHRRSRRFGRAANYRQHSAFPRLADGAIGGGSGGGQSAGDGVRAGGVNSGQSVGQPPQHLRQNDAAVAPRAPESAAGHRLRRCPNAGA